MLRILFITSASHTANDRNLNHFQRVYFLSRWTKFTIVSERDAKFSASATNNTRVLPSRWPGKAGQMLYCLLLAIKGIGRKHDIILTEPSVFSISGYIIKILSGCKWVVDVWDIPIRCNMKRSRIVQLRCAFQRKLLTLLFRKADFFILSILPDYEFKQFRIPSKKILELPNAIWPIVSERPAAQHTGRFSIMCMRSVYTSEMGLDVLADAFVFLRRKFPDVKLVIVGSIPEDIRSQLDPLANLSCVRLTGFVSYEKLQQLMDEATVFVVPFKNVPDLTQTYPIKVLEYMAEGKPIVASNIEGVSRMINDSYNGLLFEAGNAEDLANKLEKLYLDSEFRRRIGKAAKKSMISKFDCREKNRIVLQALCRTINKVNCCEKQ